MIYQELNLSSKAALQFILKKPWRRNKLLILFHVFLQIKYLQKISCSLLQNFNMLCDPQEGIPHPQKRNPKLHKLLVKKQICGEYAQAQLIPMAEVSRDHHCATLKHF